MEMKNLKENNKIEKSPRDGDEGYLSEDDNIDDDEEIIENQITQRRFSNDEDVEGDIEDAEGLETARKHTND